ncbi:primase-helicase family protein [Methylobacterium sp. P31]
MSDWLAQDGDPATVLGIAQAAPIWQPQALEPVTSEAASTPEPTDLNVLNEKYCVVRDGSKVSVLMFERQRQKGHAREVPVYLSFADFRNLLLNRSVRVSEDKKVPLGHWWLKHPERKEFSGVTFEPGGAREVDGYLNLWRGWGVEPKAGDWSRMRRHIREVLADGNEAADEYIIRWCAWAVQHPAERAQAAIVFKGKKGTGKGTLGNALCTIFGQHATHISSAEHLAGRFNSHLRDACLLFADEAYWPGDKGAEGSLKRLVTEPDLFIEAKGRDGVTVANMLHILMASNENWIVPAGEDERRYAVFNVSDRHMQDDMWFRPLYAQIAAGGLGAMLHDLLAMDLGDWHPRHIPKTDGLLEQQAQSLRPEDAWWVELLQSGRLQGADPNRLNCAVSNGYDKEVTNVFGSTRTVRCKALYDHARESSPRLKSWNDHQIGHLLKNHGCSNKRVLRRRGWEFPPLKKLRAEWVCRFPGWVWDDPDLSDWQPELQSED